MSEDPAQLSLNTKRCYWGFSCFFHVCFHLDKNSVCLHHLLRRTLESEELWSTHLCSTNHGAERSRSCEWWCSLCGRNPIRCEVQMWLKTTMLLKRPHCFIFSGTCLGRKKSLSPGWKGAASFGALPALSWSLHNLDRPRSRQGPLQQRL